MRNVVVHSNKNSMEITLQSALSIGKKRGSFMVNQWEESWHFSSIENSPTIGMALYLLPPCARYTLQIIAEHSLNSFEQSLAFRHSFILTCI